jgi:hypothetical protein
MCKIQKSLASDKIGDMNGLIGKWQPSPLNEFHQTIAYNNHIKKTKGILRHRWSKTSHSTKLKLLFNASTYVGNNTENGGIPSNENQTYFSTFRPWHIKLKFSIVGESPN